MGLGYTQAIETRAAWLGWAKRENTNILQLRMSGQALPDYAEVLPGYIDVLEKGDTYYMDSHFGRLVDHARSEIPNTLTFESAWMHSPQGFMVLETPFLVPPLEVWKEKEGELREKYQDSLQVLERAQEEARKIHAVGWRTIPKGAKIYVGPARIPTISGDGEIQFFFFQRSRNPNGFACWSYFRLKEGDQLEHRMIEFEQHAYSPELGQYSYVDLRANRLHEIYWIYSALHLMSQRYATAVKEGPSRADRKRAEREKRPLVPWIKVITLRRLQFAKEHAKAHGFVDWQWQWEVSGHWRRQWYPSEGVHKDKYIASYIKGPEDKPFKEGAIKLFVASR